jgi:hypothetical protein
VSRGMYKNFVNHPIAKEVGVLSARLGSVIRRAFSQGSCEKCS